jgi:hypothetical protein
MLRPPRPPQKKLQKVLLRRNRDIPFKRRPDFRQSTGELHRNNTLQSKRTATEVFFRRGATKSLAHAVTLAGFEVTFINV